MSEQEYDALMARRNTVPQLPTSPRKAEQPETQVDISAKPEKKRQPNKTELEASMMLACEFPGARITFEGFTFNMENGHKYKPDFVVCRGGLLMCIEVKARGANGFRQPSYQRAKLAYDQCRLDYPAITWRWMEKQNGTWHG